MVIYSTVNLHIALMASILLVGEWIAINVMDKTKIKIENCSHVILKVRSDFGSRIFRFEKWDFRQLSIV